MVQWQESENSRYPDASAPIRTRAARSLHRCTILPPSRLVAAWLGCTLLAAAASAQEPRSIQRILVDRSLQEHVVGITAIDHASISYLENGLLRNESLRDYLAILPSPAEAPEPTPPPRQRDDVRGGRGRSFIPSIPLLSAPPPRTASLHLIDGQVFKGRLGRSPDGKDTVVWNSTAVGQIALKIDHIHKLDLRDLPAAAPPIPQAAANDLIVFANGDRLEAFVESVANPLLVSINEQERRIPLDRVAQVIFANPQQTREGIYIWLKDGSVVAARDLQTTRVSEMHITPRLSIESESSEAPSPGAASLALEQLAAANLNPQALVPLSTIAPAGQEPLGGRRWTQPARIVEGEFPLDAADVLIPGPMRVYWSLPAHATRLSTTIELPRESWTWGNCQVIVSVETGSQRRELARQSLSAEQPRIAVNVELGRGEGRRLVVTLDPGDDGPVQDQAVMRRPLLAGEAPR
jgi:hypothetical protein